MSVKDRFLALKQERDTKRERESALALAAAARQRDQIEQVYASVESALEGLHWQKDSIGHYRVYHNDRPVYIEVRWHLEKYRPCDECQETEEYVIKIGVSNRTYNVPDFYCDAESFEESLAEHLLYRL